MEVKINSKDVWNRIKESRNAKGISDEQMCKELGKPVQTIRNKRTRGAIPDIQELFIISNLLDVSVEYIILGTPSKEELLQKEVDTLQNKLDNISNIING